MNQIALKLCIAACALGSASSMSFEQLSSSLEGVLSSQGGTCATGSIEGVLEGNQADCPAFIEIVLALDANDGEAEDAALHLLTENVDITAPSLEDEDAGQFVDESTDYTFQTKDDKYDQFACEVEEILNGDDEVVGTRSNPLCVEDRVNEVEAIRMQHSMLQQTSGAETDDSSTEVPQPEPTDAPAPEDPSPTTDAPAPEDPSPTTDAPAPEDPSPTTTAPAPEDPAPTEVTDPTPTEDAPQDEPTDAPAPDTQDSGSEESTVWSAPTEFVENQLALGGTCETGSIDTLVTGGEADCPAFTKVEEALTDAEGDFVMAAYSLVLANVDIQESSMAIPAEDFVDENELYEFTEIEGEYDEYGCEQENIVEIATGAVVGMRSDPDCVFLRVAEIHIIVLVDGDGPVPSVDLNHGKIEQHFSCPSASIELILAGEDATCDAFVEIVDTLDANELNFRNAADTILLARIAVDDSVEVPVEDLIHDNSDFTFAHDSVVLDDLGCHIEDITEVSSGNFVGTRSDPECVLLRVAHVEVILVIDRYVEPATNDVVSSDGETDTAATSDTEDLAGEGIPLEGTDEGDKDEDLANEGIPLGTIPTTTNGTHNGYVNPSEGIPLEFSGYNENNTIDFGEDLDLVCVNETITLDRNPDIGKQQDYVTNNRRVQEQVFLINQKQLDYSDVETADFESTCAANNGNFLIANVTTLCRRRSIFTDRILQRVTYLGVNFPVCAGQQCSADDDYHLVFAHSLLTGHEFYHSTAEGEFWTCSSSAWSMSVSTVVGIATAAAWFLL